MKTLLDWVQAARRAAPAEAMACLRAAEPLVQRASDWAMLAEAWGKLDGGGAADARRCAERAVDDPGADVSVYRQAATVLARALGDAVGARRVLARCAELTAARSDARAIEWRYLAAGYATSLDDRDAIRSCLERGAALPAPVDELCALAEGYLEHLADDAAARALVARAIALADAEPPTDMASAWPLANLHRHALRDPDAAWRILEAARDRAITVAGCLRIGRAAASHAEADPPRRATAASCATRAETLAAAPADWIAIAEAWHEHGGGPEAIRRCLDRALDGAPDAAERTRIAFGHRHWLGDPGAADRLAPRGIAPAALVVTRRRLDGWVADPAALLDWLRPQLTAKQLSRIAAADYGFGHDKHLAALRDIVDTGLIPQPLAWHPCEVLELTRWSEGARVDHLERAFACAVLCIHVAGPTYSDGHEQTLPVLIESCRALGDAALAGAVGLLVALAEAFDDYRTELGFAHLGLVLAAAARDPRDPRLPALAARTIAAAHATAAADDAPGWLLGQTRFDVRHDLWRALAAELLGPARGDPALADLADRLRDPASPA